MIFGIAFSTTLNALVRREQAERQRDEFALDIELIFEKVWIDERHIGNAVRNEVDFFLGHVVNVNKKLAAPLGHDHDPARELAELLHDAKLIVVGRLENRVQRADDGHAQVAQQARTCPPAAPP